MQTWMLIWKDVLYLGASLCLLIGYHIFLAAKTRQDPTYTFQAVMTHSRTAWVHSIMAERRDILAVQTLRNSTMAATFLASTAIFLMTGVMTISGEGNKLEGPWHALNSGGALGPEVWLLKILTLLVVLFAAFLSFTMSIRLYHHVGYMLNVPLNSKHARIPPEMVVGQLDRAGRFYWFGMRAYFILGPLVLWLFDPRFMLVSTVALVAVLFRLDRIPPHTKEGTSPETDVTPEPEPRHKLVSVR